MSWSARTSCRPGWSRSCSARGTLQATLSVVTTDYDFQGLWLSIPFNRFFVARDETQAYMVDIGLPADRITVSGIPVKAGFSQPVEREAVLARYELRPDVPTLLISAGAAGGAYTQAIVAQTLRMRNAFQAVVVCGRNAQLKDKIEALVAPHADRYRVLGYTTDMPDLMRVATLFVGKPGGLSSSECMAAGLPMVLINPIPGQEVRNSDFLLEEGAAVRCNYATTVGYKIDRCWTIPTGVRRMAANARGLGRPDAARQIVADRAGRATRAAVDRPRRAACDPGRRRAGRLGARGRHRPPRPDAHRRHDGHIGRRRYHGADPDARPVCRGRGDLRRCTVGYASAARGTEAAWRRSRSPGHPETGARQRHGCDSRVGRLSDHARSTTQQPGCR